MKGGVFVISLIIFCLIFANFVSVNIQANNLEEDPLVPGWSNDIRISNVSGDSLHPSIAVDSKGWIHVVWQDARAGDYWQIYYARSKDGGRTWEEKPIAGNATTGGNTPCIVVDQSDTLHVVWSASWDCTVTGLEIYYKNSTDGGSIWGEAVRLTYASGESFTPKIVAYENTLHVVWSDKRDGNFEIYYKRSDDGGNSWGADVRLTNAEGDSSVPSITISLVGNVFVTWTDERDENMEIYYKKSVDGGVSWADDERLTTSQSESRESSIVVDSDGNVHVIWYEGYFGQYKLYYRKWLTSNTTWVGEKEIVNSTCAWMPSLTIDLDNNLYLAWSDARNGYTNGSFNGNTEIYYKTSKDFNEVGLEIRLTNAPYTSWYPKIIIDSNNILHIVWFDKRDGNKEIYYKRTLNPVTEPPIVVTQFLNQTPCEPGTSIIVSGNATWNNTPVINTDVSVKIIETGALWVTTTDSNGNYNITITAPPTPGNYTIRTVVTLGNYTGTKYAKLTVESESATNGGIQGNDEGGERLSIIYLVIAGAVASGIIIAFGLLRMRNTGPPKLGKIKEEQKPEFRSGGGIQTMSLRCPGCRMTFSVEVKPKPFKIKCPYCSKEGMIK